MGYNIAMVSDFFYPNIGGVESHLYHLSQQLIRRGHKVIIITHAYDNRKGVRYLTNGLKVYHVPMMVIYRQATLPTIFGFFPIFRNIILREQIQIVHGHQALSSMCHEAILHARTMGLKACFTDHSLFGFADAGSILTNKLLKFCLSDVDHVICVSHTGKENTVLRAALNPSTVSVIPNAVVASSFVPDPSRADPKYITIVIISRLVYRKGTDLLVAAVPRICAMHPEVRFIIGGDGPKILDLEQMREKYVLHDRVELLGSVKADQVRDTLVQGHIYLNPSLTEAFGIGLVEAASCGLFVVSTRVGGVPEVLPRHMTIFAKPDEDDVVKAVSQAITMYKAHPPDPFAVHSEVSQMYSWRNVAERTERVYDAVSRTAVPNLIERLRRYYGCGLWAGKIFSLIVAIDFLLFIVLEWIWDRSNIDVARSFSYDKYQQLIQKVDENGTDERDAEIDLA